MAPALLASWLQSKFLPPSNFESNLHLALRWVHLLVGITWIGLLYYFNLVSAHVLPQMDSAERGKLVSVMLPRALWWFRWSAAVTVAAGAIYWILILNTEPPNLPGYYTVVDAIDWAIQVGILWILFFFLLQVPLILRREWLVGVLAAVFLLVFPQHFLTHNIFPGMSSRSISIGLGGGIGLFLLLNVWLIVWPAQKQLLAWMKEHPGEESPPELARQLRRAQLVSRASFWLTFPLLFFMAAASHFPIFDSPLLAP